MCSRPVSWWSTCEPNPTRLFCPFADAKTHEHYNYVTAEWARTWPSEELWVARR